MSINVSGGASSVTIQRPAGVATSLHSSGGANSVRLDDHRLSGFGDSEIQTPGYGSATDRYAIDVSGGASNVSVLTAA